jgi:hypothetical protein
MMVGVDIAGLTAGVVIVVMKAPGRWYSEDVVVTDLGTGETVVVPAGTDPLAGRTVVVVQVLAVRTAVVVSTGILHNKSVAVRRSRQGRSQYRNSRFPGHRVVPRIECWDTGMTPGVA